MWTGAAFWISMPMSGSGADPGTPEISSPRSMTTSVSPALMTMPVVGLQTPPSTLTPRDTPRGHALAAVDPGGTDDLDRLGDDHRSVAGCVQDHHLSSRIGDRDRGVEASARGSQRAVGRRIRVDSERRRMHECSLRRE